MTPYKFIISLILAIFQSLTVDAQTPPYYHYTTSEGLPSSTVHSAIQDNSGFIWFATQNGLSKFDGKQFHTYDATDGLNADGATDIIEGSKGEIYIASYQKGISVLADSKIRDYCNTIDGEPFSITYLAIEHLNSGGQKIYTSSRYGAVYILYEQPSKGLITKKFNPFPQVVHSIKKLPNEKMVALTTKGLFFFEDDTLIKYNVSGLPDTMVHCLAHASDGSFLIGTNGAIYHILNNVVQKKIIVKKSDNNNVLAMLIDNNNNIWFSLVNQGFYCIPNGSTKIIDVGSKMNLQSTPVNNFLEDKEGNIWLTTYGNGVFCLNNLHITNFGVEDGLSNNNVFTMAIEKSGKLIIGTYDGINVFEQEKFSKLASSFKKEHTEYIYDIKVVNSDVFVCGAFGMNKNTLFVNKGLNWHIINRPSFCKTQKGSYLYGRGNNSIEVLSAFSLDIKDAIKINIFGNRAKLNRINKIFEDPSLNVWVATNLGLCKLTNFSQATNHYEKTFFFDSPVLSKRINAIHMDQRQMIWFAGEKGVASYNLSNDSISNYTQLHGYDLSSATSLATDKTNRIWIGTMKGVYVWDGEIVRHFNSKNGLPSSEVHSLCFDENKNILYVGSSKGISTFNVDILGSYNPQPPKITITSVRANDSVYSNIDQLVFRSNVQDIVIDYSAINFSSPATVIVKHRLNEKWTELKHNSLHFPSLKGGDYNIQIIAKSQNSAWSEPITVKFRVIPRFIETFWFILLIAFCAALASMIIIAMRLQLLRKKAINNIALAAKTIELKHQALSSMMNRHFISNALNSIQYLINSHKNEDANNYLAMMANLMRKNIDTSGSGYILLSEEIYRLKLYLDLEKLRFQDNFSYQISLNNNVVPENVMIPNMIIQAFVENSLWHGILNSGIKGTVSINFSYENVDIDDFDNKYLIIRIIDDGVGIKQTKKTHSTDHISKGIQLVEERLQLLASRMHLPRSIIIKDLSNTDSHVHGTQVTISLPPLMYKVVGI